MQLAGRDLEHASGGGEGKVFEAGQGEDRSYPRCPIIVISNQHHYAPTAISLSPQQSPLRRLYDFLTTLLVRIFLFACLTVPLREWGEKKNSLTILRPSRKMEGVPWFLSRKRNAFGWYKKKGKKEILLGNGDVGIGGRD